VAVEAADVVLQVGFVTTDQNTGGFTIRIPREKLVSATDDDVVRVRRARFDSIPLCKFLAALAPQLRPRVGADAIPHTRAAETAAFSFRKPCRAAVPDAPLEFPRVFAAAAHIIPESSVVVADTGVAGFATAEMLLPKGCIYIQQSYYVSIGYSLPAALGASLAAPDRKVVLFVGDGAFQMTAQELSSIISNHCNIAVFLINNDGYTIERLILDGEFNDIPRWHYHKLPEAFGADKPGILAKTEGELDRAITAVSSSKFSFIEVVIPRMDAPESLVKTGQDLRGKS
jgi:indolepyruvate decarboxylase